MEDDDESSDENELEQVLDEDSVTDALSTRRYGQKIRILGLESEIIYCLARNMSYHMIAQYLNEEILSKINEKINSGTIRWWVINQTEAFKKALQVEQMKYLQDQVWEWERQGLQVRSEVMGQLNDLTDDLIDPETGKIKPVYTIKDNEGNEVTMPMSAGDRKNIASILARKVKVQESGERFMGIGTTDGHRFKIDVNVNIDLIDRMRELTGEVDEDYEDADYTDSEE